MMSNLCKSSQYNLYLIFSSQSFMYLASDDTDKFAWDDYIKSSPINSDNSDEEDQLSPPDPTPQDLTPQKNMNDEQQTNEKEYTAVFEWEEKSKRQGQFTEFDTEPVVLNQANVECFKEIVEGTAAKDFTYMATFWTNQFQQKLGFILDNWSLFKAQYLELFKLFMGLAESKLINIEIYEQTYPGLQALIAKMAKKIDHKSSKKLSCLRSKEDLIFQLYLKEQQAKAQKTGGSYFLKAQKDQQLGQFIADNNMLYQWNSQSWRLFFFLASALKRHNISTTSHQDIKKQCKKIYKFAELLLSNNELTQPSKRICCAKFFYMDFNLTPLEQGNLICRPRNDALKSRVDRLHERAAKNMNVKVEEKQELQVFNREMKDLMLDICALLNSGGGTVLLFAKRAYLQTWVQGDSMLDGKKQFYLKLITEALQEIRPRLQLDKETVITFVPVVKNPYQYDYRTDLQDERDRSVNRNYVQGLYCIRINLVPLHPHKLYYYQPHNQQAQQPPLSAIFKKHQRVTLKGERMVIQMKRKFEYFYVSDAEAQNDKEAKQLLSKDYLCIQRHTCPQPYKGYAMHMQQQRKLPVIKQFKYMSMLVAHKSNLSDIQRKLRNKGIECLISDQFQSLKLKSSNSSAPLYHNVRFDQIFNEVNHNKEYEYNGKYILVIAVTTYIRLATRARAAYLPKVNLNNLLGYVNKMFPNRAETIELFSFENENREQEQYIKSTTKESTLLIYYVLHEGGQKCIFKNPKSLEKLPENQKLERWKLIYAVGANPK